MNIIARSRRMSNSSGEVAESGSNIRLRRDGDDANLDPGDEPGMAIAPVPDRAPTDHR